MNPIERQQVTIKLMDGGGNVTMVLKLENAWPTKVSVPDLQSDGDEVDIESLEIVHEGIIIDNPR